MIHRKTVDGVDYFFKDDEDLRFSHSDCVVTFADHNTLVRFHQCPLFIDGIEMEKRDVYKKVDLNSPYVLRGQVLDSATSEEDD